MSFWIWFWIWTALIISALGVFTAIGFSLMKRLSEVSEQAKPLVAKMESLSQLAATKTQVPKPENSLLADPAVTIARRQALQKAKIKKQQAQERRLIASLKQFNPNESRFH
ncbi:MAG: hypothetical protein RL167_655 [Actinomycetota bacterium]|jgi:hypothetical protein